MISFVQDSRTSLFFRSAFVFSFEANWDKKWAWINRDLYLEDLLVGFR
jgi:hypothetical protein